MRNLLFSTKQREIAIAYLALAILAGSCGALLPLLRYYDHGFELSWLRLFHVFLMSCFLVFPALYGGFGNLAFNKLLCSNNLAFPRLNRFAFWLLLLGFACAALSLLAYVAGFITIFYLQLGFTLSFSFSLLANLVTAVIFLTSLIAGNFNRPPNLYAMSAFHSWLSYPLMLLLLGFVSFLIILFFPILLASLAVSFPAIEFGLFSYEKAVLPFWFFAHPFSYILLLLALAMVLQIIDSYFPFSSSQKLVLFALLALWSLIALVFWAQTLFAHSLGQNISYYFLWNLPSLGVIFALLCAYFLWHLWRGKIKLNAQLNWAIGCLFMFFIGLLGAIRFGYKLLYKLAFAPISSADLTILLGHFHYIFALTLVFAIFSGWYYWFDSLIGYRFNERLVKGHFYLFMLGVNAVFLPFFFYSAFFTSFLAIGAFMLSASILLFLYIIWEAYRVKRLNFSPALAASNRAFINEVSASS